MFFSRTKTYKKGEEITTENQSNVLSIIKKGFIKLHLQGTEISQLNEGNLFGEIKFLIPEEEGSEIDMIAGSDCEIDYFTKNDLGNQFFFGF